MRVLVGTHQWFPDYPGGSARVATDTAAGLAARGHQVHVLAPESSGRPGEENAGSLTIERTLPRSVLPQTLTDASATYRAARRLAARRFQVVLAHHPTTAVGLLATHLEAPLVFVYHASVVRELQLERSCLGPGPRRLATYGLEPALAAMERATVARARLSVALSGYSASLLRADHPRAAGRIRVAAGGVDPAAFAPAPDREELRRRLGLGDAPLILTARRLDRSLGLEAVLAATARLRGPSTPNLAIAGGGPLEGDLRRLGERLGLEGRIRFLGVPSAGELRDWYAAADLFVVSPAPHEGFGMVTLEALASGTPVVGGPRGATPELLRPLDSRLIAVEPSEEGLAACMQAALAFSDARFRCRCREYAVERFAWQRRIEEWERVLAEAVGEVPGDGARTGERGEPDPRFSSATAGR